jgi:transcriptional regulator with XRE-family HTH domain
MILSSRELAARLGLGIRLKQIRKNLSQKEFAKKFGIPFRTYQRYEYGERMPPLEVLEKIVKQAKVKISWLLVGEDLSGDFEEIHVSMREIIDIQSKILSSGKLDSLMEMETIKRLSRLCLEMKQWDVEPIGPETLKKEFVAIKYFFDELNKAAAKVSPKEKHKVSKI